MLPPAAAEFADLLFIFSQQQQISWYDLLTCAFGMAFLSSYKTLIVKNNSTTNGSKHPQHANTNDIPDVPAEQQPAGRSLLDKKAEEYLREGGKIEDYPNEEEGQEAEQTGRSKE